jgi:hypothetical protein
MPAFMIIAWLVSVFLPGHPILANLSNEQVNFAQHIYNVAVNEKINPELFLKLSECESKIKKVALGDYRKEIDTYISQGIFQFQKKTFDMYSKKYNFIGSWLNPYSQISLTGIIIGREKNGWKNWLTCGKIVGYDKGI